MTTAQVLSYGGGRQTVAMCLLVIKGVLPTPDYIVAADTGREAASTWEYMTTYVQPLLAPLGLQVEIASHDLATVDLYGMNGDLLIPAFTATGKLSTYCSNEWKARVIQRFLRGKGLTGATNWIGFTLDERKRIKSEDTGPWRRSYPLIDLMLTRTDCEAIITAAGLPMPAKSACYMCPHRTNEEWRFIRDTYPIQWLDAIAVDEEIRANDELGGVFLHQSRKPLAEADLDAIDRGPEYKQCGLGNCFI